MSRARTFTKGEILDAARAAAETGMRARLLPTGEIEFNPDAIQRDPLKTTPEAALEGWLNGGKTRGRS